MYLAKQNHQTQGIARVHSKSHANSKEITRTEGKQKGDKLALWDEIIQYGATQLKY